MRKTSGGLLFIFLQEHQLGNFQNSAKRTKNIWKLFIRYCPYRLMSEKWRTPTCAPFVWRDGAMWPSCVDTAHAQIVLLPSRFVLCAENPSHRRYNCSADRGGLFILRVLVSRMRSLIPWRFVRYAVILLTNEAGQIKTKL